jgi:hypothetical protein
MITSQEIGALYARREAILTEQAAMGWTTGDQLDHDEVQALAKEFRQIEVALS